MKNTYDKFIERFKGRVEKNVLMSGHTSYKIGGPADLYIEARTKEEIVEYVTAARTFGIPFFILGSGTNILVSDKGIRGLVIKNSTSAIAVVGMKGQLKGSKENSILFVEADAGVLFNKLVRFTLDKGLKGLEMHLGLPGTVGGAVYMNSKWMKPPGFVGDVIAEACILTPEGEVTKVPKSYFHFQYGKSVIQKSGDIVLSVTFALLKSDKDALWEIANSSISYRQETQPHGVATAGCVFKNISEAEAIASSVPNYTTSTGFLLDQAGMKGKNVGGASFSRVHANFIVNNGKGTASDVLQLMQLGKEKVKEKFHVTLKEEIQLIGEF